MSRHEPYPEWVAIGDRIRQARLELGLTQEDVSKALGGLRMGGIEIGYQRLHGLQIVAIAECLGVSVNYLLTGTEPDSEHLFLVKENQSLRRQIDRLEKILDTIARYAKTGEIRERRKSRAALPKL